jgi:hypothetical protein
MNRTTVNQFGFPVLTALIMAFTLTGCTGALSTGSSMRVEVEVYKGPLSKDKEVQLGELMGIVREAKLALELFRNGANIYLDKLGCLVTNKSTNCRKLHGVTTSADDLIQETEDLRKRYRKCNEYKKGTVLYNNCLKTLTERVTALAVQYKAKAFFWTEDQIKGVSSDVRVRAKMTDFTTLTSEYSRQIASRATVLHKQYFDNDKDKNNDKYLSGQRLAVSDHLRDASPTVFLNLYDWYQATYEGSKAKTGLKVADRVRLGKQLFDDHYWTKINEVHASGQGDVSMALIKDDIGNWNLKSFKNNPTELLDAYRKLSLAGIQAAARAAGAIATSGASEVKNAGPEALDLASNFALGRVGSARNAQDSNIRISALHKTAAADLDAVLKKHQSDGQNLIKNAEKTRINRNTEETKFQGAKEELNKLEGNIKDKEIEIGNKEKDLFNKDAELKKIRKDLSELRQELTALNRIPENERTEADNETIERLEKEKQNKTEEEKTESEALSQMEKERNDLKAELPDLIASEKSAGAKLKTAEETLKAAQENQAEAEKALQDFATNVINEARDVLSVHRRVIDALRTAQVPLDK